MTTLANTPAGAVLPDAGASSNACSGSATNMHVNRLKNSVRRALPTIHGARKGVLFTAIRVYHH